MAQERIKAAMQQHLGLIAQPRSCLTVDKFKVRFSIGYHKSTPTIAVIMWFGPSRSPRTIAITHNLLLAGALSLGLQFLLVIPCNNVGFHSLRAQDKSLGKREVTPGKPENRRFLVNHFVNIANIIMRKLFVEVQNRFWYLVKYTFWALQTLRNSASHVYSFSTLLTFPTSISRILLRITQSCSVITLRTIILC